MIKHDWYRKVVVSIAKVKQFFNESGLFEKVGSLVMSRDNENAAGRGVVDETVVEEADETVVQEEIVDIMEKMAGIYDGKLEAITNGNAVTEEGKVSFEQ